MRYFYQCRIYLIIVIYKCIIVFTIAMSFYCHLAPTEFKMRSLFKKLLQIFELKEQQLNVLAIKECISFL